MKTQIEKGEALRVLHHRDRAFIIPNPWDAGSGVLLEHIGFEALAGTSSGFSFSVARSDGRVSRERVLVHLTELAAATSLPVSADLEHGFGDTPEIVAETIRLASATGIVGGSIEDSTGRPDYPIYEFDLAVERVRAAAEAAAALPFPFTLTARCENCLVGLTDITEIIRRLQAYQEAGAHVLFAPGLRTRQDISALVGSVDRPVNVIMGLPGVHFSVDELSDLGVKRISVGSSLARAAWAGFFRAARELKDHGTFTYGDEATPSKEMNAYFSK